MFSLLNTEDRVAVYSLVSQCWALDLTIAETQQTVWECYAYKLSKRLIKKQYKRTEAIFSEWGKEDVNNQLKENLQYINSTLAKAFKE